MTIRLIKIQYFTSRYRSAVLFDLEYTAWKGSIERNWSHSNEDPEIIQIGAVEILRVDGQWKLDGEFNQYVRPSRRPQLSNYIKNLTGVTQEVIDTQGIDLQDAIGLFRAFVPKHSLLCSNGDDWN